MNRFNPQPKKGMPEKKKPGFIKRKPVDPEKNLMSLFLKVWLDRLPGNQYVKKEYSSWQEWLEDTSKYRICQITGEPLVLFDHWCFAHVLTRNYVNLREKEHNICLLSRELHHEYDFGSREKLLTHDNAKYLIEYREHLKRESYK